MDTTPVSCPPRYQPCEIKNLADQFELMVTKHNQELTQFKESIMHDINVAHSDDQTYLKLKQTKDTLIQEREQIERLKIAFDEKQQRQLLDTIDKKIATIDEEIKTHTNASCTLHKAMLTYIDDRLNPKSAKNNFVVIDVTNPEYIKERNECMKFLEPYFDTVIKDGDEYVKITFKITSSSTDEFIHNELKKRIVFGKSILGYYLCMKSPSSCVLYTIFSYLGFMSTCTGCFYYVFLYDVTHIQRYFIKINKGYKHTTDPSFPHNIDNFKGAL